MKLELGQYFILVKRQYPSLAGHYSVYAVRKFVHYYLENCPEQEVVASRVYLPFLDSYSNVKKRERSIKPFLQVQMIISPFLELFVAGLKGAL